MRRFIKATDGRYLNLSQVKEAHDGWNGRQHHCFVTMLDGTRREVREHDFQTLIAEEEQIIPAQPGWFMLSPHYDANGEAVASREPVIAWRVVDQFSPLLPMSVGAGHGRDTDSIVLCPDGTVEVPYVATYKSEAEFLIEWERDHPPMKLTAV